MARGQRDPERERQWRERMTRWQASGLSVRAFCGQQGLLETSFYYWKRELRVRDQAASRAAPLGPAKSSLPKFVPVTVLSSPTVAVEVRCPSGHVVCLPSCEVSALADLFAALNSPASEEPAC